jgi:hypothetical protein
MLRGPGQSLTVVSFLKAGQHPVNEGQKNLFNFDWLLAGYLLLLPYNPGHLTRNVSSYRFGKRDKAS